MNLLSVPSSVMGLMGGSPQQRRALLGLVQPMQADAYDEAMFAANPNGYQQPQMADSFDEAMFAANPNGMNWADASSMRGQPQMQSPHQAQPMGQAPRQRVSALNVLGRALAPNITGALDTERARLQAEADRPNALAMQQENERIARALGPQALLAYRSSPEKFGESLGYAYRPTTTGAGGVSTVFGTGQQVEAPRVMEFGNDLIQAGPISGTQRLATRGPSYAEQTQMGRLEQDAAQAEARLDLDYRRLDQAASQFNQTYEQREREYLRQADAREAANGGRGKITEGQAKDGFNASRLEDAGAIIAGIEGQGFDFGRSGVTGGQFRSRFRSYDAAAEEWVDAMLRLTTGAAATKQEMASNRRAYFPQTGDSEAVRKQKAARRAQLQQDAIARAGPGYFGGSADSTGAVPPPHRLRTGKLMAQTAVNPQTGERLSLVNNQWVPAGSGQSAAPRAAAPRQTSPRQQIRFRDDVDAVARTMLGEAGNQGEQGMLAVGGVIANRARQRGISPSQVVLQPSQFEPWGNPETTQRLMGIASDSPEYQQAYAIAQRALGGEDVTGGASHFYAPKAQAALGRAKPSWDNGTGRAIGDHLFFNLDGEPASDAQLIGAPQQPSGGTISEGSIATNPQTGERVVLQGGQWVPVGGSAGPVEVDIDGGVQNLDGRAIVIHPDGRREDRGPWEDYWASQRRSQEDREARIEREADPEYQRAIIEARAGAENVPDQLRALGLGATYGFLTDINAEAQRGIQAVENAGRRVMGEEVRYGSGVAAQAARDAMRDAQNQYAAERPVENFALQAAGGFIAPGVGAGGRYIAAAANPTQAMQRAMQVGTATGVASGLGYGEGNLIERADDAAVGGVVGLGAGAIGQGAINLLSRPRAASTSATRTLSREGTQLTPGAIGSRIPVLGPVLRGAEEAADTIPFVGAAVSAGRQRMTNTFNRAALNRVLGPLEEQRLASRLPTGWREDTTQGAGYEAVRRVQNTVSRAYDDALEGVSVTPDQQFYDDLAQVTTEAAELMPVQMTEQLANILQNRVFRTLEFADSPMTGEQFKAVESVLGTLAREQRQGLTVENKAFASALDDTRGVLRDLVARQRPDRAPEIQAVNRAYSNLVPIEEAAGSTASQAAEGVFTPNAIAQASARGQTRRQRAVGEGRMQDLTSAGKAVVSSRIGDSGTATRTALTTLSTGLAGTAAFVDAMTTGLTVAGVSAVYSKPFIAALNAAYRATDSRQATAAFRDMEALARQNPALVPFYESALANATGLSQRDTPAIPQAQPSTPVPSPALQRVMQ